MRNKFLFSAALLIESNGFAAAQGTSPGGAAAPAPAQQSAPPEKMAPAEKSAPATSKDAPASADKKATQSDKLAPKAGEMKNDTSAPKNAGATETKNPASPAPDQKAGAAKSSTDTKAGDTKSSTADTKGATAAPPAEKQTQISSAIKQEKVEEVTNVNFNISIGTAVPSTVRYYPLPPRIIEIYPEWRGYDFILVRGKYIILRPRTHEIVYIIEG